MPKKQNKDRNTVNAATKVLRITELARIIAGGLQLCDLVIFHQVCSHVRHVQGTWHTVRAAVSARWSPKSILHQLFACAHKPSIQSLELFFLSDSEVVRGIGPTLPHVSRLKLTLDTVSPSCFEHWTSLKVLELRMHTDALSTLGPITVDWQLQSLVLEVDGVDDACDDPAATDARKSNFNKFVISLLLGQSSFKTLRDIKLRFEHLTPNMYSSQNDPEVLRALSTLSGDRQLGDLELVLQPFVFPRIWARSVTLVCREHWSMHGRFGFDFPGAEMWASQIETGRLVFSDGLNQEGDMTQLTTQAALVLPRTITQFELACCNRVLFDLLGFGFTLTPSLRVLEIEMAILTERSAWTITDNCPNLQRVAIGAHCKCENIHGEYLLPAAPGIGRSRYGADGHVIRRLVNDLASLNTMKIKNCTDASFTKGFCGACNCHKLAILLGPSEWDSSSVRLLELEGFEREQSDEARVLIPSHIDLMFDGRLKPPTTIKN